MAIKNAVSGNFDPRLLIVKSVFECRLSAVLLITHKCKYIQSGLKIRGYFTNAHFVGTRKLQSH